MPTSKKKGSLCAGTAVVNIGALHAVSMLGTAVVSMETGLA